MNPKKILSLYSALCFMTQPLWADAFGLFTYTDNGTSITITDYPDTAVGPLTIPATIVGKPVTMIASNAFDSCSGVTSVTIPDSVTGIGNYAFSFCTSMTGASLGNNVSSIGDDAFSYCTSLTAITVNSLNSSYSSLDGVLFDKNKTTLIRCPGGKSGSYTTPDTVTYIASRSFSYCTSLTSVTIQNSVNTIGDFAFYSCSSITSVTIPDSLTTIGDSAFRSCSRLSSFTIPVGVTFIGSYMFFQCSSLTSVTVPNGVTSIGYAAFLGCSGLTSINIPNSVRTIGGSAFEACASLASFTIPNSVTIIGTSMFEACTSLSTIIIPSSVTIIGGHAFESCTSLANIIIPSSVTSIGYSAFSGCTSLISITIPADVNNIVINAFGQCAKLSEITVDPLNPTYSSESGILFNKNKTMLIQHPAGRSGSCTIPGSVTTISEGAFEASAGLTGVTMSDGITTIGRRAFAWCTGLTAITLPNSIVNLGANAFDSCTSLSGIIIPNQIIVLEHNAFVSCTSLTSVIIGNSVAHIGTEAFGSCKSLASVTIPASVTTIEERAFFECDALTSISIPDSVITLGTGAFKYCDSLTQAYFNGNAPAMESYVFDDAAESFTIYYYNGKTGFTSPTWMGYPSIALGTVSAPEIGVEQPAGTNLAGGSASVSFKIVALGANVVKTFTIKNTGNANLTGLAITKGGSHAPDFVLTAPLKTTLAPGTATTFTVVFKPRASGTRNAAIHIASNDADENPFDIMLTGTGVPSPEIAVQQPVGSDLKDGLSSKSFGSVALKSTLTKTFTIRNTGTANLTNLAISKNGANAKDFTVTNPLKTSLPPGASTTFKVKFRPSAKGTRKAAIHIMSNDSNENPFDIVLTGKGIVNAAAPFDFASAVSLPSQSDHQIRPSIRAVRFADGRKYLTLTVMKSADIAGTTPVVEVSPNLIDWFSGSHHTTVITDDATFLKVRDNTPLAPGKKRYIRMGTTRD